MKNFLTLGSLFDGSGGFPLAGINVGIKPLWASEIEPFPILVTRKNLPQVEHLGDIGGIDGGKIAPVDIVSFGSPCQDLSLAGKRVGIKGEKSSLFFEAVRIIKEMRKATNGKFPKYAVWENVPGALSSNKGKDFYEVLCALSGETNLPRENKWGGAGVILAPRWSIAWRILDAQFFGVPQRRRRIFLICDFDGQSAGKILFEPQGVSRNLVACREAREKTSQYFDAGVKKSATQLVFENHSQDSRFSGPLFLLPTITARLGTGGNNQPLVVKEKTCFDVRFTSEKTKNYRANVYQTNTSRTLSTGSNSPDANQGGLAIVSTDENKRYTVRRLTPRECGRLQGFPDYWCENLENISPSEKEIDFWVNVFETYRKLVSHSVRPKSRKQIIKWLQNPYSDSAQYKMWGNGVALPCVEYVLSRITKHYPTRL